MRRRFERIATSIDEGVFTYRRLPSQWVLDYASPAWGEIFGLEITPTAGDVLEEYIHPDDIETARAGWDRVDAGEWVEQEYRVTTPQGQLRWVNERLRLRVDEGGEWIDGIVSDITVRRSEEQRREKIAARLRVMSRTDGLTGLANRRHLSAELERCLGACREGGPGLGLLLLDLDRFKVINDSFGHEAGDAVLRQTAERIAEATADAAAVAGRWGGEEFCVLVPGLDAEGGLRTVAETLRAAISSRPMRLDDGSELTVTATIGGTVQVARDGRAEPGRSWAAPTARSTPASAAAATACCSTATCAPATPPARTPTSCTPRRRSRSPSPSARACPRSTASRWRTSSARTAEHLRLPAAAVLRARLGGWLHDVGKIAIPDGILGKPGALDEAEWEVMRAHPVVGAEVVRRVPGLELASAAVEQHHERWDGTGYPGGRSGDEIALEARIVACADAYSAITSDRVYRAGARPAARASTSCGAAPARTSTRRWWRRWWPCSRRTRPTSPTAWAWPADRRRPADRARGYAQSAAGVAESVDAPDLGSGGATRGSSSLPARMNAESPAYARLSRLSGAGDVGTDRVQRGPRWWTRRPVRAHDVRRREGVRQGGLAVAIWARVFARRAGRELTQSCL